MLPEQATWPAQLALQVQRSPILALADAASVLLAPLLFLVVPRVSPVLLAPTLPRARHLVPRVPMDISQAPRVLRLAQRAMQVLFRARALARVRFAPLAAHKDNRAKITAQLAQLDTWRRRLAPLLARFAPREDTRRLLVPAHAYKRPSALTRTLLETPSRRLAVPARTPLLWVCLRAAYALPVHTRPLLPLRARFVPLVNTNLLHLKARARHVLVAQSLLLQALQHAALALQVRSRCLALAFAQSA